MFYNKYFQVEKTKAQSKNKIGLFSFFKMCYSIYRIGGVSMNELLNDLEKVSLEQEAIKPLMEKIKRALEGDKNINLKELQQELEQYINSNSIESFEGLKEDLQHINEQLEIMANSNSIETLSTDPIGQVEPSIEEVNPSFEDLPTIDPTTDGKVIIPELSTNSVELPAQEMQTTIQGQQEELSPTIGITDIILSEVDRRLQDDKLSIIVSAPENNENTRDVLIGNFSYSCEDADLFDHTILPEIYNHLAEAHDLEVLTDNEVDLDLRKRFMVSDPSGQYSLVLLDLPVDVLKNMNHLANSNKKVEQPITEEITNAEVKGPKQYVKTFGANRLGFANGLSIGMAIGTAIVLLLVALMYFGIIKL